MALAKKLLAQGTYLTIFTRKESLRSKQFAIFDEYLRRGQLTVVDAGLNELAEYHRECGDSKVNDSDNGKCVGAASVKESAVFYHLAWAGTFGEERNNRELQDKNIAYAMDAVRLAKRLGCNKFVGVGSQAEYRRIEGTVATGRKLSEDAVCEPYTEYGRAKYEAGIKSGKLAKELGMEHAWVRVFSVYGPYDGANTMISMAIRRLGNHETIDLTAGIQIWDYLFSEDAAKALCLIGEKGSGVYNLGGGTGRPLKEYIDELCDAVGADRMQLNYGAVAYAPSQVMYLVADITRLTEDTGFIPETSFYEGVRITARNMGENQA